MTIERKLLSPAELNELHRILRTSDRQRNENEERRMLFPMGERGQPASHHAYAFSNNQLVAFTV